MNKLSIIKDEKGTKIMLDDKKIQGVKEYQVKGSANGSTELTLVMDATLDKIKETAPEVPVQEQLADLLTIDSEGIIIHYGKSIVNTSKESTDYSFTE